MEEVPDQVKKDMTFHFVQKMDEVIRIALKPETTKRVHRAKHSALKPSRRAPA